MSYTDPCRGDCGANHWPDCEPSCSSFKPPVLHREVDPMPDEADYTCGAADSSGEIYDMVDSSFEIDLAAWKKRNNV